MFYIITNKVGNQRNIESNFSSSVTTEYGHTNLIFSNLIVHLISHFMVNELQCNWAIHHPYFRQL